MKTTLVLVAIALATCLMLAVLASIKHPPHANQMLFEVLLEQPNPPTS